MQPPNIRAIFTARLPFVTSPMTYRFHPMTGCVPNPEKKAMGVSANRSSTVEKSLLGVTVRLSRPRGERGACVRATERPTRPERDPIVAIDAPRESRADVVRRCSRRTRALYTVLNACASRALRHASTCAARVPIRAKVCGDDGTYMTHSTTCTTTVIYFIPLSRDERQWESSLRERIVGYYFGR